MTLDFGLWTCPLTTIARRTPSDCSTFASGPHSSARGTPTSIADGRAGFSSGPRKLKIVRCPRPAQIFRAAAMCLNAG